MRKYYLVIYYRKDDGLSDTLIILELDEYETRIEALDDYASKYAFERKRLWGKVLEMIPLKDRKDAVCIQGE
jgi:hypothetical protein